MTSNWAPIVVAYDGSEGAQSALEWAAVEARARKAPLRIVYAADYAPSSPYLHMYDSLPDPMLKAGRQHAQSLLDEAEHRAREWAPGIAVTTFFTESERPASTIVRESLSASTVVVGSRKRGAIGSIFLGSIGAAVSQRAACPVVVVRGPAGLAAEGARVVVGVDGSGPSEAALEFAFEHASVRELPVEVVLCWPPDALTEMSWRPPQPAPETADALVAEIAAGWREKFPDVDMHTAVVRESPAAGLVAAANGQDLLVVGRHGRHVVPGVALGSTPMGVLHHATCPVAVVPSV